MSLVSRRRTAAQCTDHPHCPNCGTVIAEDAYACRKCLTAEPEENQDDAEDR